MSDFYGYVDTDDDITQYTNDGLRKAHSWVRAERQAWGDDCPPTVTDLYDRILAEMTERGPQ